MLLSPAEAGLGFFISATQRLRAGLMNVALRAPGLLMEGRASPPVRS
jgi:hypothetical protein